MAQEHESLRELAALREDNLQTLRYLLTPNVLDTLYIAWEMWKQDEHRQEDFLQWCFHVGGYTPRALPPVH